MTSSTFSEVRRTEGFYYEDFMGVFAYFGHGFVRSEHKAEHGVNAGHPHCLALRAHAVDGVLPGKVKVTRLRNSTDHLVWYSLRSMGPKGNGRVVYLREDATVAVCSEPIQTIDSLYHKMV